MLRLRLLLPLLILGVVAAVETAGRRAKHAVMTGVMPGHAADHGALDAASGLGTIGGNTKRDNDEQCGDDLHDSDVL